MVTSVGALRLKEDGSGLITRSGRNASQNPAELSAFIELLQKENVTRYLEIGARHGDTFFDVMRSLAPGSFGLACDLPGGNWGTAKSKNHLARTCDDLRKQGYSISCLFGDSQSRETANKIVARGPFDAALIDGDHLYEGVKKDWKRYHAHARLIAFHDIAGEGQTQKTSGLPVEVPRLWRELKDQYPHVEFIDEGSKMGIGVLWLK